MPGRIAGIASLFVDGVPVTAKGACEYNPNLTKREPIMAMDGSFAGYREEGEPPYIQCDLLSDGTVTTADLYRATNVQVIAKLANGYTVTGHSMTLMDPPSVKNDDSTFTCKWIGPSVEESLS